MENPEALGIDLNGRPAVERMGSEGLRYW